MPRPAYKWKPIEQVAARKAHEKGMSIRNIALALGIPQTIVFRELHRPWPEDIGNLEVIFPINGLTPSSPPTLIRPGDMAYCAVSDVSGIDDHPKLKLSPAEKAAYRKAWAQKQPENDGLRGGKG